MCYKHYRITSELVLLVIMGSMVIYTDNLCFTNIIQLPQNHSSHGYHDLNGYIYTQFMFYKHYRITSELVLLVIIDSLGIYTDNLCFTNIIQLPQNWFSWLIGPQWVYIHTIYILQTL